MNSSCGMKYPRNGASMNNMHSENILEVGRKRVTLSPRTHSSIQFKGSFPESGVATAPRPCSQPQQLSRREGDRDRVLHSQHKNSGSYTSANASKTAKKDSCWYESHYSAQEHDYEENETQVAKRVRRFRNKK